MTAPGAADRQLTDELLTKCLHCGMCLPVCPTYNVRFDERSSPRGRIRLIQTVFAHPSEPLSDEFVNEMNFCLDCQACETACPAGVQYGQLVETARHHIHERKRDPMKVRFMKFVILRGALASRWRTRAMTRVMRVLESSGLRKRMMDANVVGASVAEAFNAMPVFREKEFSRTVRETILPVKPRVGKVAFLTGCIMDGALQRIHKASVEVLLHQGYEVVLPRSQGCCGSLHGHNGDVTMAKELAKKNIDAFASETYDAIIVNSGGCSGFMKEYARLLSDEPAYRDRARGLAERVRDIHEFLGEKGFVKPTESIRKRVTYHDACHLVHTQKISRQPREVIRAISGIEFVELPESTWCCGSAGIYNVLRPGDAQVFLKRKMENLAGTGADIVLCGNPGCHFQLEYGIQKFGLRMEVMHPIELLRLAYGNEAESLQEAQAR